MKNLYLLKNEVIFYEYLINILDNFELKFLSQRKCKNIKK